MGALCLLWSLVVLPLLLFLWNCTPITLHLAQILTEISFIVYTGNHTIKNVFCLLNSITSESYNGQTNWIVTLEISVSGCFSYYLLSGGITKCKQGHFYVDPCLTIQGRQIPPEAIILQTVLPKCLGSFDQWEEQLKYSAASGYNMIHFTPVQELGRSQSSYSIYDQLKLNSKLFSHSSDEQQWLALSTLINNLEKEYGMLSMTDLVWNHTADNSPWLAEHPEAGYNLENSPHLKAAFDFDEAIMQFSKSVNGTAINDEEGIADILNIF